MKLKFSGIFFAVTLIACSLLSGCSGNSSAGPIESYTPVNFTVLDSSNYAPSTLQLTKRLEV